MNKSFLKMIYFAHITAHAVLSASAIDRADIEVTFTRNATSMALAIWVLFAFESTSKA